MELRQAALAEMLKRPWQELTYGPSRFPPPDSTPIPGLPVYPGLRCPFCPYISRTLKTIRYYLALIYPETQYLSGHAAYNTKPNITTAIEQVSCQRFYLSGLGSSFFSVTIISLIQQQRLAGIVSEAEDRKSVV